jgi:hypothetical protein
MSLRLPEALDARLTACARKLGRSKSDLARDLIQEGLNKRNGKRQPTCLELAGDLVGCLQGPGDLSFNKKYMEGFGKSEREAATSPGKDRKAARKR